MSETPLPNCSQCDIEEQERACRVPGGKGIKGCPTLLKKQVVAESRKEYQKKDVAAFALQASIQEAECFADRDKKPFVRKPVKPRIQEICEFAHRMGYRRLGLAFCSGLKREALLVDRVLRSQGFEIVSAICKAGCVPKEHIGIKDEQKIRIGEFEPMCNPVAQAKILNDAGTEFNVVLGLCVGHDSLFFKYADAPTTVLAAKDRVTGHNPLAPFYTLNSYYSRLLSGKE
ncbi:MAG: DUF1847 domain-containing protein [Spirochaetales bacterium]|nr:DUF1847 domain-containing protein [Spirochaetales bacterium]